jgi:hypothetical protein
VIRTINSATKKGNSNAVQLSLDLGNDGPVREEHSRHSHGAKAPVLPYRRAADDYLKCFWYSTHAMFPIIHKPTFNSNYEQLWRSERASRDPGLLTYPEDDIVFISTLNIAFAIGCHWSNLVAPADRTSLAEQFHNQSMRLVPDPLDLASLQVVQLLLMTGFCLHFTRHAIRCWNTVGLAITVAVGLGLNVEHADVEKETQLDREMRRRIWHCCVVMDRYTFSLCGYVRMLTSRPESNP